MKFGFKRGNTSATPPAALRPTAAVAPGAVTPQQPRPDYIANIDGIAGGIVQGWARDKKSVESLSIDVYAGLTLVGQGVADEYRADLAKAFLSNGRHGFRIAIRQDWQGDAEVTLREHASGRVIECPATSHRVEREAKITIIDADIETVSLKVTLGSTEPTSIDLAVYDGDDEIGAMGVEIREQTATTWIPLAGAAYDGDVHTLRLVDRKSGNLLRLVVVHMPRITTPWEFIRDSATTPGILPLNRFAGQRYESLRLQVRRAAGSPAAAARMADIMVAHDILSSGLQERRVYPKLTLPPCDKPLVSIILPVHNQFHFTYYCLASLILSADTTPYEVILADDASTDETATIGEVVANLRIVRHEANLGFGGNCNAAAATARGEYLVFLNNDTEVLSLWLDELIGGLKRLPLAGLVGSKLINADGTLQEAGGVVWNNGKPWNVGRNANAAAPEFNYARQADYVSGAALCIPKSIWKEVGAFSKEFQPAYYEDTDLAFKVRKAGYGVWYVPQSEIIHFEGGSNGTDLTKGVKQHQVTNASTFKRKWGGAFSGHGREGHQLLLEKDRALVGRVLFIDHALPNPSKDAGSYAAVQEARLFQALGYKVTFLSENMAHQGASTTELQRQGIEAVHAPYYRTVQHFLQERGQEFDLVYITRYDVAIRCLPCVREATRAKVLFNNADLHFLRELRAAMNSGGDLAPALAVRDRELQLMRQVDVVLSYTEVELAVIFSHNLKRDYMFQCPWVVEPRPTPRPFAQRRDIAFLGSYRHMPNVEAVKFFVKDVMPELSKRLPGVRFLICGSNPPKEFADFESDSVEVVGFVEDLAELFDRVRIMAVPLLSGAGIKGKALDAMSYGLPMAISDIGAEGIGLSHGVSALVVRERKEWVDNVVRLYSDEALWTTVRNNALAVIKESYSFAEGLKRMQRPLDFLGVPYALSDADQATS